MNLTLRRWSLLSALLVSLITLSSVASVVAQEATPVASPEAEGTPVTQETATHHGINVGDMDLSADPTEDFNRFVNGGWLDRTEIPADRASMDSFTELSDQTQELLIDLMQQLSTSDTLQDGTDEWKAVQVYNQTLDLETRNRQGFDPIQPTVAEIDAITDLDSLHTFLQESFFKGIPGFFPVFSDPGLIDSSVNEANLYGPDLWLPSKDYYVETDEATKEIQVAYVETLAELLGYLGYDDAKAKASGQAVFDFEQTLAEQILSREETQDINNFNNPRSLEELQQMYPLMDWQEYFSTIGVPNPSHVLVNELRYMEALAGIIQATPLETIKDTLKLQLLWNHRLWLSEDIQTTSFNFRSVMLSGVSTQPPAEERALDMVTGVLGEAIGQIYVDAAFPPEAKAQTEELVAAIVASFREHLEANTWLSPESKQVALDKLAKMGLKIGYPDKWRTYEDVSIEASLDETMQSAVNAEQRRTLAQIDQPVDRSEWFLLPQEVNAGYAAQFNEMIFPAAILQPPFFDYQADPASNFGAIGWVIGHEITHGFDLQGAQFDANGNFVNWWSEEDSAEFAKLNQKVADQYSAIEVLPGLNVDGQNTVTENVADLGGMRIAFDALQRYLEANGRPSDIDGFTQEQRFFIAAATVWRAKEREESLVTLIQTDPHAPSSVRATQPARNTDAFHEAFGTAEGDAMYLAPADRIVIW